MLQPGNDRGGRVVPFVMNSHTRHKVLWLTNDPRALRTDNRRVLQAHSERHLKLINQGGEQRHGEFSDGAYRVHPGRFGNPTEGKIPRNVLTFGHSCADQRQYKRDARAAGLPAHGAPMPLSLASFLVEFMSSPGTWWSIPSGVRIRPPRRPSCLGGGGSQLRSWSSTSWVLRTVSVVLEASIST